MTKFEIRKIIERYLMEVVGIPTIAGSIIHDEFVVINALSKKLSEVFHSEEKVNGYLDYVADYLDSLNKYIKKKGGGRIPYTKIFKFAIKTKILSEFLMQTKIEEKRKKDIAGFDDYEDEKSVEDFSVPYKGEDYLFLYSKNSLMFFFSVKKRQVVVQLPSGNIRNYDDYKKLCEKKRKKVVGRVFLYKTIGNIKSKTDCQQGFLLYIRQERAKIARRKEKKRTGV